jgi:hypothetical protein
MYCQYNQKLNFYGLFMGEQSNKGGNLTIADPVLFSVKG